MKAVLLHGPATVASRKHLSNIKLKFNPQDIEVFEKNSRLEDITLSLSSYSLFSNSRLVILENPQESFSLENLKVDPELTFIIWFDHEVGKEKLVTKYVQSQKGEILFFPESKEVSVFPFLDLLGTKNPKAFIELEKLKKAGFDIIYLITMVLYLLRTLSVPNKNAPKFVQDKLEKQKRNFPQAEVERLYKFILNLEYKIKVGEIDKNQAEFSMVHEFLK